MHDLSAGDRQQEHVELEPAALACHAACRHSLREVNIDLRHAGRKAQILAHSPAGRVPALLAGGSRHLGQPGHPRVSGRGPSRGRLWPESREARAHARCVAAEMHSGFQALAPALSDGLSRPHSQDRAAGRGGADVRRIVGVWRDCRRQFGDGGPFLFGAFSAADAMYAPVASRFRTYLPDLAAYGDDGTAQAYVEALFALPAMVQWEQEARSEIAARS